LPFPSSVVADTVTWNYVDLKPLDSISIALEMQVLTPPTVNINDTLKFKAFILPVAADLTPANDTSYLKQLVVGSYDPNDKQERFAGRISLKEVTDGSYINYMIRFQNTGNDTAFTVRIMDTLENKLDWSSLQMVGSTHSYNLTMKDGNKLQWTFNDIKLPDSTKNFNKSVGFIAFRIKPKSNLSVGDVIQNKASIYFDYNLPVITNTVITTVVTNVVTGVRDIQNREMKFVLAPNPNTGQAYLHVSGRLTGKFEMSIIDNSGKMIMSRTIVRNTIAEVLNVPVDMQQLPAGVYYIKLQQKEKLWWQKVVLQ
jgi:fimbrial isopeptide formation D2 family protein